MRICDCLGCNQEADGFSLLFGKDECAPGDDMIDDGADLCQMHSIEARDALSKAFTAFMERLPGERSGPLNG